ncbi:MAG: Multiple EGF-like-domain protein 3 precursor [Myxococcaceae bacterium]|nr:Multiple EGF-like-domain protein 3 precursor [Myxococcaceae bacterium]
MRRIAIACLGALAVSSGCSFIDDFDKFKPAAVHGSGDDDGGQPSDDLDSSITSTEPDANSKDASSVTDAGRDAGAETDAATDAATDASTGPRCGDGKVDTARGEACDDGNQIAGDGCEPVTCQATPVPICGLLPCNDDDPCTRDTCDPFLGCQHRAIDGDSDGYAPGKCKSGSGLRGGDCNDSSAAINPGAVETCDGVDNNCDGAVDEKLPTLQCYPDLDNDGYANLAGMRVTACVCPALTIPVKDPSDKSQSDCWDSPTGNGANVYPGQTKAFDTRYGAGPVNERSFDYNCDGKETPSWGALPGGTCGGLLDLALCSASEGYAPKVPECGMIGTYVTCSAALLVTNGCQDMPAMRTQLCN